MAVSSSYTIYVNLADLASDDLSSTLSLPSLFEITSISDSLSLPTLLEVASISESSLSGPVFDVLNFLLLGATVRVGDMGDIIQVADNSSINVNRLTFADKTGSGNASMVAPTGASFSIYGYRIGFEAKSANYEIPQEKSGYVWRNTAQMTYTLPSGATVGTTALFIRTGTQMGVKPDSTARLWAATSGAFRPAGVATQLTSSGAKVCYIADGSNNWYPVMEEGTLS